MNALELLKADHQKVKNLFVQVRQSENVKQKRKAFEIIRNELLAHTELEETIFYPTFEANEMFKSILEESYEEHADIKDLLDEIEELQDNEEEDFEDLLEELMEDVEHHVEEEEGAFFQKVRTVLSEPELDKLGQRMVSFKEQYRQSAA